MGSTSQKPSKKEIVTKKDEYLQTFTIHGLTRICTGTRTESIFWLSMLLCGLMVAAFVLYGLIHKYFQYEIYTEVKQEVTMKNVFPSITFCDFNIMMSNYFVYCGAKSGKHKNVKEPCTYEPVDGPEIKNMLQSKKGWSNGIFKVGTCITWGGKQCANNRFLKSLNKHNHSCFTWNWNGDLYDAYSHANIEFELNKTSGKPFSFMVALIHDHKITELEMTNTVVLEPKKTYELKISKTMFKRLPAPFPTNCTNGKPGDMFPGKYTRRTCVESMTYINMYKKCGASFDYYKKFLPEDIKKQYKKKNQTKSQALQCIHAFSKEEIEDSTSACPFPCEEFEFLTVPMVYEKDGKNDHNRSIYRVHVQYTNVDSYRLLEEKQLYAWNQMAGEVGGFLGLVIGASILSFFEILAFLFLCLLQKLCK